MGVLKSVEPTGFLAFAPAFAGTNWADVNRRIIQNCPRPRTSFVFARGFASLGRTPIYLFINTLNSDACYKIQRPPDARQDHQRGALSSAYFLQCSE